MDVPVDSQREAQQESLHQRRATAALSGHRGDPVAAMAAAGDTEPSVRLLGFGALARLGLLQQDHAQRGLNDTDSRVVRRVLEAVAGTGRTAQGEGSGLIDSRLVELLAASDDAVAETAAWALGERHQQTESGPRTDVSSAEQAVIVGALCTAAVDHHDALVRESAAAALGAIGLEAGLDAILRATQDKVTVRRRAILALASFDGPDVLAALERARTDRDWQVRQAAEDLLRAP